MTCETPRRRLSQANVITEYCCKTEYFFSLSFAAINLKKGFADHTIDEVWCVQLVIITRALSLIRLSKVLEIILRLSDII